MVGKNFIVSTRDISSCAGIKDIFFQIGDSQTVAALSENASHYRFSVERESPTLISVVLMTHNQPIFLASNKMGHLR